MTTVSINLSQSTATTLNALRMKNGETTVGQGFDLFFQAGAIYNSAHPYYSTISLNGSTARLGFSDGASTTFNGVVLANPNATSGTATATSVKEIFPTHYQLSYMGLLNFQYSSAGLHSTGGNITAAAIQTLTPTYSSLYDNTLGNVIASFQGAVTSSAAADFSGVVTSMNSRADHFISLGATTGTFYINGNGIAIGQNLATTSVAGTINSYSQQFNDGSFETITSASIPVTGSSIFNERVFSVAGNFPDNDVFDINLPATIYQPWAIASGAGNDVVTINGGGTLLSANLGDGNDTVVLKDFGHTVDGGIGIDAAIFSGNLSNYTLTKTGNTYTVRDNTGTAGTDTVTNIESLKFSDKTVNLTIQAQAAAAPQADVTRLSELYVAFFNRVPDADGLSFWIDQMNAGQSINQISDAFYSAGVQYSSLTGFSASMSDAEFVKVIYKNVLGRAGATAPPDTDVSFWANNLTTGTDTRGSLINTMLGSAHSFKGDATWGWVPDLLDNKIAVAKTFAIDWGLNYNTSTDSITQGMAIAAAVTPTSTAAAIALIGVSAADLHLV